jgi:hypothetical protein
MMMSAEDWLLAKNLLYMSVFRLVIFFLDLNNLKKTIAIKEQIVYNTRKSCANTKQICKYVITFKTTSFSYRQSRQTPLPDLTTTHNHRMDTSTLPRSQCLSQWLFDCWLPDCQPPETATEHPSLRLGVVTQQHAVRAQHEALVLPEEPDAVQVARDVLRVVAELERVAAVVGLEDDARAAYRPYVLIVLPRHVDDAVAARVDLAVLEGGLDVDLAEVGVGGRFLGEREEERGEGDEWVRVRVGVSVGGMKGEAKPTGLQSTP